MLALATAGPGFHHGPPPAACVGHGCVSGWIGHAHGCCCYIPCGPGGMINPVLFTGSGVPRVTPDELKTWNEYLAELDLDDRDWMADVWSASGYENRKKLLGMLKKLREDAAKREKEEKDRKEPDKKPEKKIEK